MTDYIENKLAVIYVTIKITGLRFMRSLYLLKVPELYIRGTVETTRGFLIRKYLAMIFVAWFVMTGLVHLVNKDKDTFVEPVTLDFGTFNINLCTAEISANLHN